MRTKTRIKKVVSEKITVMFMALVLCVIACMPAFMPMEMRVWAASEVENPYKGCRLSDDGFYYRESGAFAGKAVIVNYVGEEQYVPVPETVGNMEVNQLAVRDNAFVQELYIADGITIIDGLSGCGNLTTIHFPQTIDMIDAWFEGDYQLKHLYIPPSITYINPSAFDMEASDGTGKVTLQGIVIHGESGSYAEEYAEAKGCQFVTYDFEDTKPTATPESAWAYELREDRTIVVTGYEGNVGSTFTVPDEINGYTVTGIGRSAFKGGLEDCRMLILPESLEMIDVEAFEHTPIESVYFSGTSMTEIGAYAFAGCEHLRTLELPDGVEEIGYSAFEGCTSLTSATFTESVVNIKTDAFAGCEDLETIIADEGTYAADFFHAGEEAEEETEESPAATQPPAGQESSGVAGVIIALVIILLVVAAVALYMRHAGISVSEIVDAIREKSGSEKLVTKKAGAGESKETQKKTAGEEKGAVLAPDATPDMPTAEDVKKAAVDSPKKRRLED